MHSFFLRSHSSCTVLSVLLAIAASGCGHSSAHQNGSGAGGGGSTGGGYYASQSGSRRLGPLNASLEPLRGGQEVGSAIQGDALVVPVLSGGDTNLENAQLGRHCIGYTNPAPSYAIALTAPAANLRLMVESSGDDALVVLKPDGTLSCNNDARGNFGTAPVVDIQNANTGVYYVWVTNSLSMAVGDANLHIRLDTGGGPSNEQVASERAVATSALDLTTTDGIPNSRIGARFRPIEANVQAGGPADVRRAQLGNNCVGNVPLLPQYIVETTAALPLLRFFTTGSTDNTDLTMVVSGPNGRWICRDDGAAASHDPDVEVYDAQPGTYRVWVGVFNSSMARPPAALHVTSETRADVLAPHLRPIGGTVRVTPTSNLQHSAITAGGPLTPDRFVARGCRGFMTQAPTAVIEARAALSFLRLYVSDAGAGDPTMAVRKPDGTWACGDDSFGGEMPSVELVNVEAGSYQVWVGAYRANETIRARLNVTRSVDDHP